MLQCQVCLPAVGLKSSAFNTNISVLVSVANNKDKILRRRKMFYWFASKGENGTPQGCDCPPWGNTVFSKEEYKAWDPGIIRDN